MKTTMKNILLSLLVPSTVHSFAPSSFASISNTKLEATVGLYYGTVGGNTKNCANHIKNAASGENSVEIREIDDVKSPDELVNSDVLIVGAPTWNTGAPQQRSLTGWDEWLYNVLPNLDLAGKKVAFFGVGDQGGYPFNYCDAVGELYSEFEKRGCDVKYGRTSTDGYTHMNSKAQVNEDEPIFYGLCMDEESQADQSQPRAEAWIQQLKSEGFFD